MQSDVLFSYVNLREAGAEGSSVARDPAESGRGIGWPVAAIRGAYARFGRRSIPPERLLRALLLQAFYSVRSKRQLMEQLKYNLLFRWLSGCRWMTRFGTRR
jgi:hypothetical protein